MPGTLEPLSFDPDSAAISSLAETQDRLEAVKAQTAPGATLCASEVIQAPARARGPKTAPRLPALPPTLSFEEECGAERTSRADSIDESTRVLIQAVPLPDLPAMLSFELDEFEGKFRKRCFQDSYAFVYIYLACNSAEDVAAAKIQAVFRGRASRKKLQAVRAAEAERRSMGLELQARAATIEAQAQENARLATALQALEQLVRQRDESQRATAEQRVAELAAMGSEFAALSSRYACLHGHLSVFNRYFCICSHRKASVDLVVLQAQCLEKERQCLEKERQYLEKERQGAESTRQHEARLALAEADKLDLRRQVGPISVLIQLINFNIFNLKISSTPSLLLVRQILVLS